MINPFKSLAAMLDAGSDTPDQAAEPVLGIDAPSAMVAVPSEMGGAGPTVQDSVTLVRSSDPQVIATLGGAPAASGFAVTPDSAMRVSACYAAVRLLCGAIASIPLGLFREVSGEREAINPDLWWLLNEQPISNWTAASMWEWVIQSICLRGDGYVEIVRKGAAVYALRPLHPDAVSARLVGDTLIYTVWYQDGTMNVLHQDDILHFPSFGFNGIRSMSAIQWGAFQSLGVAMAADNFSGSFFANGAAPKHLLTFDGNLNLEQTEGIRNEYRNKYAGANKAGMPMVLTKGWSLETMSMSAGDAQLLESRKFQVIDIARAFGVPPHMIGAQETTSSWGTGIEQITIGFVKFSLAPHLNRIRQELNRKLFRRASPFAEHEMDALLAGDAKSEADYMRQAVGGSQGPGWMTINEVRKKKNLPPIDGGDVLYQPQKLAAPAPAPDPDTKDENEKPVPADSQ